MARKPFIEKPDNHDKNRSIIRCAKTAPAILSNGEPGVMFAFGNTLATLSAEEVHTIASRWIDALADAQEELDSSAA